MGKNRLPSQKRTPWLLLGPIYLFTLLFVALPILYLFLLSFLRRAEVWGVDFDFTLENPADLRAPVFEYL